MRPTLGVAAATLESAGWTFMPLRRFGGVNPVRTAFPIVPVQIDSPPDVNSRPRAASTVS
ncbi:hypothetical protein Sme01_05000 [Sphaerisporangium melleum]|uniref:Uncharacterized protein n=1 Tax=Sphaerisporangium melleum TaxID=321316 RepID=A0A917VC22_9ACTN|nr:hypothetical protein GCM10007964_02570 [Sphaerisporangium melleum]GII68024.1 hypothetical protein Sme01_05000 [Sphaerisporangium melleum]